MPAGIPLELVEGSADELPEGMEIGNKELADSLPVPGNQ